MDVFTEVIRQHSASLHAIKTAKKVKTFALFLKVVSLPRDLDPWLRNHTDVLALCRKLRQSTAT